MAKKILSIVLALTLALGVFTVAASAATINATAESFENDYKTAANGDVIVLTEDVEIYGNKQTSKDITVDLAGHTITCTAPSVAGLFASSATGKLTITDSVGGGKIDSDYAALQAQTGATVVIDGGTIAGVRAAANFSGAGNIVVNDGVVNTGKEGAIYLNSTYSTSKPSCTVNGGEINGDVFTVANCVLTVNGGEFTSDSYCIVGNGTKKNTEITINGGTFTATSAIGAAIYHPQGGTLVINDGTFTGADALYIKSGTTIINGGTFVGNGEAAEYSYNGNGFNTTGDAIVVDSCGYPSGTPVVRIYDGDFSSEKAASVKGYTYGNNAAPIICIYDGEFSDDAAETYASTTAVYNSTTGVSYDTFEAAAQAAAAKDTLVLYKDVVVGAYTAVTDVTIDLSGCDITSAGNAPLDAFGTITVKDSIGGGKIAGAQRGIWVNTGATLTVDAAEVDGVVVDGGALTLKNAYIDGYVATSGAGSSVSVTGTTTTVTDQVAVAQGTLTINNGTFEKVYVYDGSTATIKNGTYDHISVYDNAVATINNGTFGTGYFATGGSATVKKGTFNGQINISDGGALTIDGGTFNDTIVPVGGWPVNGDNAATAAKTEYVSTLVVNGGTFTTTDMCISGNGTDVGTANVTINGGTFRGLTKDKKVGVAVFWPSAGTLVINAGSFTGSDAVYIKSGNVEINGGTFSAVGVKADYVHTGNGFNTTGDTIVVESCGYPGGDPSLTINGGTFASKNGEIIGYYVYGDHDLADTGFIVDGTFGKQVPSIYYADPTAFTLFNVKGGKATVDGDTVTITADEGSDKIEVSKRATNGSDIVVDTVSDGVKVSKSGTLYSSVDGTASVTVPNAGTYTVVFDFAEPEVPFVEMLRTTNAEVEVNGTTIVLTPINAEKSTALTNKLADNKTTITFSNLENALVSKYGSLYSNVYGRATAEINGDEYTVIFNYEVPEPPEVALEDNLRVTNAAVTVNENVITLTPANLSKQVSFVPKTQDGKVINVLTTQTKVSKYGTLYTTEAASATVEIDGTTYTVVFDFPIPEAPAVEELLKVKGAQNISVSGDSIYIIAPEGTKVTVDPSLTDGTKATFGNREGGAKVSKYGTLYATKAGTAEATIGGTTYTIHFTFATVI